MVRRLAPAFLVLAGKNSNLIFADEVEISSRLPYKSRVGLVVMVAEAKAAFTILLMVTTNVYAAERMKL